MDHTDLCRREEAWGGHGDRVCLSQGLLHSRQLLFGNPLLLSLSQITSFTLTLTLAAWGSTAVSLCADVSEKAHRGLRDAQSTRQFVVLRKTTLESQRMENRKSMACEDWEEQLDWEPGSCLWLVGHSELWPGFVFSVLLKTASSETPRTSKLQGETMVSVLVTGMWLVDIWQKSLFFPSLYAYHLHCIFIALCIMKMSLFFFPLNQD